MHFFRPVLNNCLTEILLMVQYMQRGVVLPLILKGLRVGKIALGFPDILQKFLECFRYCSFQLL